MRRSTWVALSTIAALCVCVYSPTKSFPQSSARTQGRSLDQLIDESDVIVHGYVLSSKIEPHPQLRNLMTVVVSMNIKETYKGGTRKSLVFRQYVWDVGRGHAASEYKKGEELVILLRPVSEYGLTSPAGLEQGRFRIVVDRNRRSTAVNGRGNFGLFDHLEKHAHTRSIPLSSHLTKVVRQHQEGSLLLADLEDAIRTFSRSR